MDEFNLNPPPDTPIEFDVNVTDDIEELEPPDMWQLRLPLTTF